jgi:hypothetical protein
MNQLSDFVTDNTLVLFDLDHTVFEGAEVYGHANWFYDRIREGKKQGITASDTIRKIFPLWLESQERTSVKPVEPQIPSFIKQLQARGLKVMGFTARWAPMIPATLRQLEEIDVHFESSSLTPANLSVDDFEPPVAYGKGVLFMSEFFDKSLVLKAYLERIRYEPQRIVIVDDCYGHLKDVVGAFASTDIAVVGLHYPLVEQRRSSWNPVLAERLFSDQSRTQSKSAL